MYLEAGGPHANSNNGTLAQSGDFIFVGFFSLRLESLRGSSGETLKLLKKTYKECGFIVERPIRWQVLDFRNLCGW